MYRLNLKESGYVLSLQFVHLFIEKFWTPGRVEAKPANPVHVISTFGNKNYDSTFLAKSMPSPPVIFQLTNWCRRCFSWMGWFETATVCIVFWRGTLQRSLHVDNPALHLMLDSWDAVLSGQLHNFGRGKLLTNVVLSSERGMKFIFSSPK